MLQSDGMLQVFMAAERQGAVCWEPAVREPIAAVHLARVHGVRTDPGVDDFQRRVFDSLRILNLARKTPACSSVAPNCFMMEVTSLFTHSQAGRSQLSAGSRPVAGGGNAQAVHLRARRQNGLGGIARSAAGVRDRGGGIASASRRARPGDCGRGKTGSEKNERYPRTLKNAGKAEKNAKPRRRATHPTSLRAWAGSSQRRLYPSPRSGPRRSCTSGALVRLR